MSQSNTPGSRPNSMSASSSRWIINVQKQFDLVADKDGEVTLEGFKKALALKEDFFAARLFHILDKDKTGGLNVHEWVVGLSLFHHGTYEEKLKLLFQAYDVQDLGYLDFSAVRNVIKSCVKESRLTISEETIDDLVVSIIDEADKDLDGRINFEELSNVLKSYPGVIENLTVSSVSWLQSDSSDFVPDVQPPCPCCPQFDREYAQNRIPDIIFVTLYFIINIVILTHRSLEYYFFDVNQGPVTGFDIVARACGQALNFNCSLVVALMLRVTLTLLRATWIGNWLPIDKHIKYHKYVAVVIVILSTIHTFAHIGNFAMISPSLNITLAEALFTTAAGIGWVGQSASITGWLLVIILIVLVIGALPCVRRSGHFEVFFFTHFLYAPWLLLVFLHGSRFWMWFIAPCTIFICEKIYSSRWLKRLYQGQTHVKEGVLLASRVTHLVINRPSNFDYGPGDYLFINIPKIAKFEWHPFTISSAPEQSEYIWLHIRGVGQWTNKLYDFFDEKRKRWSRALSSKGKSMKGRAGRRLSIITPSLLHQAEDNSGRSPNGKANGQKLLNRFSDILEADEEEKRNSLQVPTEGEDVCQSDEDVYEECDDTKHDHPYENTSFQADESEVKIEIPNVDESKKDPSLKPTPAKRNKLQVPGEDGGLGAEENVIKRRKTVLQRRLTKWGRESHGQNFGHLTNAPFVYKVEPDNEEAPQEESLEVYLDGPYGSPSAHIFSAEHAVLIASGIGVTPFASILQSIMLRYKIARHVCPRCNHGWTDKRPITLKNLKKVDFFWISRDQKAFEWFVSLMSQLEIEQQEEGSGLEHFLDMNVYLTAAVKKNDLKGVLLQMALDLVHSKEARDKITGLRTRTQAGRPDWDQVFSEIKRTKHGKVTVFFCGNPALAGTLRAKCRQFGFNFRKENF
ncbi:NADPH oxidase 5 [Lingula anatina]|uniref:NADPH oxidase 5 n=1 Tax=Lingula anatina TaxID=7574 RepID=A0A1S3ISI5_LINAN|nr:NADPH oxidase 5 [Lingula anatina]|eukprot:XP_013401170.1 NADPH oxidase 5 [Lingula anatina]